MMHGLGYTLGNVAFVRHAEAILIYKKIKQFFACIPTFFRLKN